MGKKGGTGRKDQGSSRAAAKRKDAGPISGAAAKKKKKHLNRVLGDKGKCDPFIGLRLRRECFHVLM